MKNILKKLAIMLGCVSLAHVIVTLPIVIYYAAVMNISASEILTTLPITILLIIVKAIVNLNSLGLILAAYLLRDNK